MADTFDVMVAGHLCLDVIPQFPDTGVSDVSAILTPGKLVNMGPVKLSTGGAVSNTGIALQRLGNRVCYSARVGDDEFGGITREIMARNGDTAGIRSASGSVSSYTIVIAPPRIDRIFLHNPGANNEYGPEDLDPDLVAKCRLFHFGYPPLMRRMYLDEGRELAELLRIAKEAGATTSCDMALPDPASEAGQQNWPRILANILPYVDVFLPSAEEALVMLERERFLRMKEEHRGASLLGILTPEDYGRLANKLLELGAKITSLKSGHLGVYLKTGPESRIRDLGPARPADVRNWSDRELWCPSFTVPAVASATGAGDSSIAGFLTSLLRGLDIEQALQVGNCLGWQNVQVLDAVSGIKSWEETLDLLRTSMAVDHLSIESFGWHWNGDLGVWTGPSDALARR